MISVSKRNLVVAHLLPLVVPLVAMIALEKGAHARDAAEACLNASEQAVDLHKADKLIESRAALATCAASNCPEAIRTSCIERLASIKQEIPSIILIAKDPSGRDVASVSVTIDGVARRGFLDGHAIELNTGAHEFTLKAPGRPPAAAFFVVNQGEQNRREEVSLGASAPPSPGAATHDALPGGGSAPASGPATAPPAAPVTVAAASPAVTSTSGRSSAQSGMVAIPAGSLLIGSNDGKDNEKPVHRVEVAAFAIDATEVTVAQYAACVTAHACPAASKTIDWPGITSEQREDGSVFCNGNRADRLNHPVNCVDATMAEAYCHWSDKRLPTEEEWEYAARGTDGRAYPWGNREPTEELCWNRDDGTCAVGSYPAGKSPFGVMDMVGNVTEWTQSSWSEDYSKPRNPVSRIARGASWNTRGPLLVRAALRPGFAPTRRSGSIGFRCAK